MELNRTSLPSKMKVLSMATPITGLVTSNTMMMMMTTLTLMVPRWKPMLTYRKLHVSTYCITQYCGNILIYMTRTVCKIYPEDIELEHPHFSNLIQEIYLQPAASRRFLQQQRCFGPPHIFWHDHNISFCCRDIPCT